MFCVSGICSGTVYLQIAHETYNTFIILAWFGLYGDNQIERRKIEKCKGNRFVSIKEFQRQFIIQNVYYDSFDYPVIFPIKATDFISTGMHIIRFRVKTKIPYGNWYTQGNKYNSICHR